MSARKNVNQSRPRALADDGADDAAGAAAGRVTFVRRASRPPANSRASVDTPTSPPPRGTCGVGRSAECPLHSASPHLHAANTSTPKVTILRTHSDTLTAYENETIDDSAHAVLPRRRCECSTHRRVDAYHYNLLLCNINWVRNLLRKLDNYCY